MAIVKMRKLDLIAMSYEKDKLLDLLQRMGVVEVTAHSDTEYAKIVPSDSQEFWGELSRVEGALALLTKRVEDYEKEKELKSDALKDGFEVSYEELTAVRMRKAEIHSIVEKINALTDEKNLIGANLIKIKRQIENALSYAFLLEPFDSFKDTAHTKTRLGILPTQNFTALQADLEN